MNERYARYNQSEKGKARYKRYDRSERGLLRYRRWQRKHANAQDEATLRAMIEGSANG